MVDNIFLCSAVLSFIFALERCHSMVKVVHMQKLWYLKAKNHCASLFFEHNKFLMMKSISSVRGLVRDVELELDKILLSELIVKSRSARRVITETVKVESS